MKFAGYGYEQASREADRLIKSAALSGAWHQIANDLVSLKEIMDRKRPLMAKARTISREEAEDKLPMSSDETLGA